ncbi:unknown [Fusobacterium sp. CAG:439]|nr:unknown [Fusobacterium sp. CAG:439]
MFCFNWGMENCAGVNQNMKNPQLNVGVLNPPDSFNKPVLYSHVQASKDFGRLNQDIYTSMKNSETIEKHKTPKSVFAALGVGLLAVCHPLLKKIIKH